MNASAGSTCMAVELQAGSGEGHVEYVMKLLLLTRLITIKLLGCTLFVLACSEHHRAAEACVYSVLKHA
jgi:hypothetical protein